MIDLEALKEVRNMLKAKTIKDRAERYKKYQHCILIRYKKNTIEIAKHHKKFCSGHCTVSLNLLREMAEEIGVTFTKEEIKEFL